MNIGLDMLFDVHSPFSHADLIVGVNSPAHGQKHDRKPTRLETHS